MNLDGKDPAITVEYDETDELFLEETSLQAVYETMVEEEQINFDENLAEIHYEDEVIRNLISKEVSDE